MSTTEHMLIDLQHEIEATLDLVRKERLGASHPGGEDPPAAHAATPPVVLPRMQTPASRTLPAELAQRDLQIARELLHLQRTLSRQTFRGAESARRLVRRLIRRAELNAREVTALGTAQPAASDSSGAAESQLPQLLDRLASQLADLRALGRRLGSLPDRTDLPSSEASR
jgi:hypothetical protein